MDVMFALDVKGGLAVHGVRGERCRYRVPVSRLATDPRPASVLTAVRRHTGIDSFYVADLDSIGSNRDVPVGQVLDLPASCPWATLWLDAGVHDPQQTERLLDAGYDRVIVGLETLPDIGLLGGLYREFGERVVFSLDLRDGVPLATDPDIVGQPPEIILGEVARHGASDAIVLDVAMVGSRAGYSARRLQQLETLGGILPLYVGGGMSTFEDAERLLECELRGVIVATLIYDGTIGRYEVDRLAREKEFI